MNAAGFFFSAQSIAKDPGAQLSPFFRKDMGRDAI